MKRMLSLLTISTLSTSALPTVGLVLNSNAIKNLSLKEDLKSVNGNPFIHKIVPKVSSGKIKIDYITNYAIAPNGTIYVSGTDPSQPFLKSSGLWKSTDGVNFIKVNSIPNIAREIQKITIVLIIKYMLLTVMVIYM